jgi:KTSC domain
MDPRLRGDDGRKEMPEVVSRVIRRIAYDKARGELTVIFRETGTYVYAGVPPAVYDAFLAAPSKGAFFNESIRDQYRIARSWR